MGAQPAPCSVSRAGSAALSCVGWASPIGRADAAVIKTASAHRKLQTKRIRENEEEMKRLAQIQGKHF